MSPRGGYRKPGGGVRTPGIGKDSQRTDANQPIRVANVGDSTDLTHGDRQKLEAGQRVQRIGRASSPSLAAAPPRGGSAPPTAGVGAGIPDFLTDMPTNRPDEPLTSGMDMGPGSGSDILGLPKPTDDPRIMALERYARELNNPTAQRYLDKIYRPTPTPETVAAPAPQPTMAETEVPMEDDFGDEELGEETESQTTTATLA